MRLVTLGGLKLEPPDFQRPKPLLLLAYLALEGPKERRHLSELFWSDASEPATSLRVALGQLRKGAPNAVLEDGSKLSLALETDVLELLEAIRHSESERVAALSVGAFLEGFVLPDWSAELEEWVYASRESVAALVRGALLREAEQLARTGDFGLAARRAEAAFLVKGVKAAETDDLMRLYVLLLAGDSVLAAQVRSEGQEFGLAFSVTQADARAQFAAVNQSTQQFGLRPLPYAKTSFVGRDPELIELANLFASQEVRLVTLLGTGGIGKTRLALQLAHDQLQEQQFQDGVYFIALENLENGNQIPRAILDGLGISVQGNTDPLELLKSSLSDRHLLLVLDNFEQLIDAVLLVSALLEHCPKLCLLVTSRERLNLEEEFVLTLSGLPISKDQSNLLELEASDAVRLFVQRAKRTRVDFVLNQADLIAALEICRLVEGVPLGIELAAAWVKIMPVAQIALELSRNLDALESNSRNISERHRSLRAVFEHSWNLLSQKEQLALARLAVFQGGFTREAASAVTGVTIPVLASLVDKSLLRVTQDGRYDRHALLYQYAFQKLEAQPAEFATMLKNHCEYFLAWTKETRQHLLQANQAYWLDRLELERPNFEAAMHRSELEGNAEALLGFCVALGQFWLTRGYLGQGRAWFNRALAVPGAEQVIPAYPVALSNLGYLAQRQGEYEFSRSLLEQSLTIFRSVGEKPGMMPALSNLAHAARMRGDMQGALNYAREALLISRELNQEVLISSSLETIGLIHLDHGEYAAARQGFEESLAIRRSLGLKREIANTLSALGETSSCQNDLGAARKFFAESQALFTEIGDKPNLAYLLHNIGDLEQRCRDYSQAKTNYQESLRMLVAIKDMGVIAFSLEGLAASAAMLADPDQAACLWGAAEALRETTGIQIPLNLRAEYDANVIAARTRLGSAAFGSAWAQGRNMKLEDAVHLALGGDAVQVENAKPMSFK